MRHLKGFSFIELIIALAIIGAIITAGASYLKTSVKSSKTREEQAQVLKISATITNYAKTHKYLPNETLLKNIISSPKDVFGNEYIYFPSAALTENGGNKAVNLCNINSTGLTINICKDNSCTSPEIIDNVSYVIGSKSIDGTEQTKATSNGGKIVVQIFANANSDDILRWSTLEEIKGEAECAETSGSLKILNTELPPIKINQPDDNNIVVFGEGGAGDPSDYGWCVEYNDMSMKKALDFYTVNSNGNIISGPFDGRNKCDSSFVKGYALKIKSSPSYEDKKAATSMFFVHLTDEAGTTAVKKFAITLY